MRKWLLGAAVGLLPAQAAAAPNIGIFPLIYGIDDRQDVYETADPDIRKLAESTVALFDASGVSISTSGVAKLATQTYGEKKKLVAGERFYSQPSGAFCSGALVGADLVLTAGHCVRSQEACSKLKVVFGYSIASKGQDPTTVPASDVYSCKTVVRTIPQDLWGLEALFGTRPVKADWAILRLDRSAQGRSPLGLGDAAALKKGSKVFSIGHPSGLPAKVAGGASVTDASGSREFKADLDTYRGNSGSPVFDATSKKIVGVLVRGGKDFVEAGMLIADIPARDGPVFEMLRALDASTAPLAAGLGLERRRSNVARQGTTDSEAVTRSTLFKDTLARAAADPSYVEVPAKPAEAVAVEAAVRAAASLADELFRAVAPPPAKVTR